MDAGVEATVRPERLDQVQPTQRGAHLAPPDRRLVMRGGLVDDQLRATRQPLVAHRAHEIPRRQRKDGLREDVGRALPSIPGSTDMSTTRFTR